MRIGLYDPYLDTLSGGEKYLLSIALCLSSQHEVFVFWDKEKESEIRQAASKKLGINLAPVKFYKNIFARNESFISRFLESRKFDAIVYLSDGSIPFVGTKLFIHFQFPIEWVDGLSLKTKIKLNFVRRIFCNSYYTKQFVDKKLNVNSMVLYPPINIAKSNINKEKIILHVGRFDVNVNNSNYKKQDVMINVFKKMVDKGLKDWKFVMIIGVKKEDKDKVKELRKMSIGYPVEILENPSNQILWDVYSRAKIYWHATGFGENLEKYPEKAEHFGISTVEAMGTGAVPVVINAGGQKEIVADGRSGYLWDTLSDFAEKTKKLATDNNLWEKMSQEAIKQSNIFSEQKFCKSVKDIIK